MRPAVDDAVGMPLPWLMTERDELAEHFGVSSTTLAALPPTQMYSIKPAMTTNVDASHPIRACATVPALVHPQLRAMASRVRGLGYELALDNSLRHRCTKDPPRSVQALYEHLATVGAYFSPRRRCIGLAIDSAWHEAVHEAVHLTFDAHVRNRSDSGDVSHPLREHYEFWRGRGYSKRQAEEMVCREHELYALRNSGKPAWRWGLRALLVWDSALVDAERDLEAQCRDAAHRAAADELRRVRMLRRYFSGPWARARYAAALGIVAITMSSAVAKRCLGSA